MGARPTGHPNGTNNLHAAMVAPVGALSALGLMMGPAAAAVAKDLVKPQLTTSGNWAEFSARFPLYLRQLSAGQGELPDEFKLSILEGCIPQSSQHELQRRLERGEPPPISDILELAREEARGRHASIHKGGIEGVEAQA